MHLGRDRVICAYEIGRRDRRSRARVLRRDAARRRSAPSSRGRCCSRTSTSTTRAPRACSAGAIPDLQVYVHERGAPHLVDPSKLLKSAGAAVRRRHGAALGRGRAGAGGAHHVAAAAARRSRASAWPTRPGTPPPRVLPPRGRRGDAYVGDVAGVRIPPHASPCAPTPPPDIDVEAWLDSLDTLEALGRRRRSCLTHFGQVDDVAEHLHRDAAVAEWTPRAGELRVTATRRRFIARLRGAAARTRHDRATRRGASSRPPRRTSSTWASSATGARTRPDVSGGADDRAAAHRRARRAGSAATGG